MKTIFSDAQRLQANLALASDAALRDAVRGCQIDWTEASIQAASDAIMKLTKKYLDHLFPAREQQNQGLERTPRTPFSKFRDDQFSVPLRRVAGRYDLSCQRDPAYESLISQSLRHYGSVERPSMATVYAHLLSAFHSHNEERRAAGLVPLAVPTRETFRRHLRREFRSGRMVGADRRR